jgi:hypothetical protein
MMRLFGENKTEEKPRDVKSNTLQFVSSTGLPSTDAIDKCADNKHIPNELRKEYWFKDPVHASLITLDSEGIRKQRHEMEVVDMIEEQYSQRVKVYVPGEDPKGEISGMRINTVYNQALNNSNVDLGKSLRDQALATTHRQEVMQEDKKRDIPKPATGLKKLLGIGV